MVLSGDVWGDYKVWKVSQSGKKIILEMDKNEILTKGDRLHLQNNLGKCWLQVVKVKSPYALVAADRCLFTIEKGNLMVHSQYFSSLPKLGFEEDKKELSIQETRAQEPVVLLPRIRSKKKYSFHSLASLGYFPYDQFSLITPPSIKMWILSVYFLFAPIRFFVAPLGTILELVVDFSTM